MSKQQRGEGGKHTQRRLDRSEEKSLHVKEFSVGRPNEISFNVLEKLASAQDAQEKAGFFSRVFKRKKTYDSQAVNPVSTALPKSSSNQKKTGKTSEHSPQVSSTTAKKAVSTTIPLPSQVRSTKPTIENRRPFLGEESHKEIKKRQQYRKRYRTISIAIVIMVCLGLLGFGGYNFYLQYQQQTSNVAVLQRSCDLIEQADNTIISIDTYFQQQFGDDTIQNAQDLLDKIPEARNMLSDARVLAEQASQGLYDSTNDKEAAEHALASIAARETLLDVSESRLKEDIAAKQAMDTMNEAYDLIQQGNSLLSQAAQEVSTGGESSAEQINKSSEHTNSAKTCFEQARDKLASVSSSYSDADISIAREYVEKRIEQTGYALASNDAMLIQDKSTAEQNNDLYNTADQAAVALAEQFADSFDQPIIDTYVSKTQSLIDTYNQARNDMGTNDDFLRSYLGE